MSGIIDVSSTVPTMDFLYGDILNMPEISFLLNEGYISLFCFLDSGEAGDLTIRVTEEITSNQLPYLSKSLHVPGS